MPTVELTPEQALDERLNRIETVLDSHGYDIGRLQGEAERSARFKKYLAIFLAGAAYGIILVAILES